ncbi:uncharacterized protein LOC133785808 [Humulus lupulus]|uniref:uncharacterized protein LOC133785808 n=1 Tax=Humulus lupulus TaxID=3486 RepID=UPI002B408D92|nr:uncharacterized protein LOC133785808 [Humulus lupulus]
MPCISPLCWTEPDEHVTIGPQIIASTTEKIKDIQERLKVVQSHQKGYVDVHRQEVEFEVGDYVFLKVTPMRGVTRFGVKDPLHIIEYEAIPLQEDVTYEEQPIRILVKELKVLRNREILEVNVF